MQEKQLSEKESLELISTMIQRAREGFNENGAGAILWGTVIGICGFGSFLQGYFDWFGSFDFWILTLLALVPQAIISIRESRQQRVRSHSERAIDAVWLVYGISIFAMVAYFNLIGGATERLLTEEGIQLWKQTAGKPGLEPFRPFAWSSISLLLLLFAIPTLITGLTRGFWPMTAAGILCYGLFFLSLFTDSTIDNLLAGMAGIINWLIPGLLLRSKYLKLRKAHV